MKKLILIAFGLVVGLFLVVLVDHLLEWYLVKIGYFKAEVPNITYAYNTTEYQNTAKFSSQGLRNREVQIPKPSDTYRILALGDSFTHGLGVKDVQAWPSLLEKYLRSDGKKIEIINTGQPGMGTGEEIRICQIYSDRFQADAIILGFYATNDLYENASWDSNNSAVQKLTEDLFPAASKLNSPLNTARNKIKPGQTVDTQKEWKARSQQWIKTHYLAFSRLDSEGKRLMLEGKMNPFVAITATVDSDLLTKMLDAGTLDYAVNATSKLFTKLKKSCGKNRQIFIVLLPSMEITSKEYLQKRSKFGYSQNEKLLSLDLDKPLSRISKEHGFTYLSLLSSFRQDKCPGCFYNIDTHLTPVGNRRVAQFLFQNLKGKLGTNHE